MLISEESRAAMQAVNTLLKTIKRTQKTQEDTKITARQVSKITELQLGKNGVIMLDFGDKVEYINGKKFYTLALDKPDDKLDIAELVAKTKID